MLDTRLSSYLNGMLDLASSLSEWIGYSNAGVSAYTKDGWEEAFRRHYHVKQFTPVPAEETFYQTLVQWLGSTSFGLTKNVIDCITYKLGEPLAVYRAENEKALIDRLSGCNGGIGAYYFTEDVFFVEFKTHVLAFIMGNWE
ncbi:MAG: hypothetical protein II049_08750 [Clostridia bacterium]|nr:hypothetical protein [Clostridia bacterium]